MMLCAEPSGLCVHIYVLTDWISWSKYCFELGENLWCTYCSHRYGFMLFFEIHFSSIVRLQTHQSSFWEMEVTEKAYAGSCC